MALNKKDLELITGIVNTSINPLVEEVSLLKKEVTDLKKSVKTLSTSNVSTTTSKATTSTKSTAKKSTTKSTDEVVRCLIDATSRIDNNKFKKLYSIVKKYDGRIKHSKDDEFAHWTFSEENGKKFANEVAKSKIFGKSIPLKSSFYKVATK